MLVAFAYGVGKIITIIGLLAFVSIIIALIVQRARAKESEKREDQNSLLD